MDINWNIVLDVQIGPKEKLIHFLVAESLFPSVIIGLHGMKSLGLKVDLEKSSVFVYDFQIPFILLKGVGVQENQIQKSQFK